MLTLVGRPPADWVNKHLAAPTWHLPTLPTKHNLLLKSEPLLKPRSRAETQKCSVLRLISRGRPDAFNLYPGYFWTV